MPLFTTIVAVSFIGWFLGKWFFHKEYTEDTMAILLAIWAAWIVEIIKLGWEWAAEKHKDESHGHTV